MTTESFETRLQRFYDSCTPEEQQLVAAMCGLFVAAGQVGAGDVAGYANSSAMAFQVQTVMGSITQSTQTRSNLARQYHDVLMTVAGNFRP